eukprot:TRINITY_DN2523_c0_g1_i1.p1 TRINITY_DN2523_c0_g1~~TRINITY_DN2523_c0_g1_i1.p1  ORF type:complete len:414 (+),score=25.13 TRINITY_DN2523_c0_g1_i1:77-1318(+)
MEDSAVTEFAYNLLQTLLEDTTIYNFLNAYPKDQWGVIIRSLSLHTIRSTLYKHSAPPPFDKIESFCNSPYESNSPYILHEELNDVRSKLLGIDKQLLGLIDATKVQGPAKRMNSKLNLPSSKSTVPSANTSQTPLHTTGGNESLNGTRSVSSNKYQKAAIKHSVLVPQCKEIHEVSKDEGHTMTRCRTELNVQFLILKALISHARPEPEKIETQRLGTSKSANKKIGKHGGGFVQGREDRENMKKIQSASKAGYRKGNNSKQPPSEYESKGVVDIANEFLNNSIINKFTLEPQKPQQVYEEVSEADTDLRKFESPEKTKEWTDDSQSESYCLHELRRGSLNVGVLRSREANVTAFGKPSERKTVDSSIGSRKSKPKPPVYGKGYLFQQFEMYHLFTFYILCQQQQYYNGKSE